MHDSFEFMSEQSSRKNSAEQNPQDAVKPLGGVAAFRRTGFDGTGAVCAPGSLIPQIPVPLAVRGTYRVHAGEPGDVRVGSI